VKQWIDDNRIFPRLFAFLYIWMCIEVYMWYIGLPVPTNGQSGFATGVLATSGGYFKFYVDSGKPE